MQIIYSPEFSRRFKRLPEEIQELAIGKESIFKKNPFDLRLKTHKLHGKHSDCWAFSINYEYRVIFEFSEKNCIVFIAIGDHSIYK